MASMEVAAAARAAAQQRPHDRWAAEFAGMSLQDHPQHVSGCDTLILLPALRCKTVLPDRTVASLAVGSGGRSLWFNVSPATRD